MQCVYFDDGRARSYINICKKNFSFLFKFEKELANVRLDYSDMENQLQEAILAKDREVDSFFFPLLFVCILTCG